MKKITFLLLFFFAALTISVTANASIIKPKVEKKQKNNKAKKPTDRICTDNQYFYTECCDGVVMLTGYSDFAYWCESGQVYYANWYVSPDGCGYSCI